MNHVKIREITPIKELHNQLPLSDEDSKKILRHRQEIKNIINGSDNRLILLIGPCSAWPCDAVVEYAKRLAKLNQKVQQHLKIIMRVYPHKPRTSIGWHGALFQPDIFAEVDINKGLFYSRQMMLEVIKLNLPVAAEILNLNLHEYLADLLSWVAIGARSSENQEHRVYASSLDIPVGLKNPTHGDLEIAINSIIVAQHSHSMVYNNSQFTTFGNKYAHLVLRGGNKKPNFSKKELARLNILLTEKRITNPALLVDVSHDNSIIDNIKHYKNQTQNIIKILNFLEGEERLNKLVKGFMVESFLQDGNQEINLKHREEVNLDGLSLTDPCIGWESTENLIYKLYENRQRIKQDKINIANSIS